MRDDSMTEHLNRRRVLAGLVATAFATGAAATLGLPSRAPATALSDEWSEFPWQVIWPKTRYIAHAEEQPDGSWKCVRIDRVSV